MAHHYPAPERAALTQEVVIFHAGPGGQLLQTVLPGNAAVDKEELFAQKDGGQGPEEGQFRGKLLPDGLAQDREIRRAPERDPRLLRHLPEHAFFPQPKT